MRISTDTMAIIEKALQIWERENEVTINNTRGIFDRDLPAAYEINWSAMGDRPTEDAREYAKKINRAADIADALNALEIIEDRGRDLNITREEYINSAEKIRAAFDKGAEAIRATLEGIEAGK